jgi:hypothetical protein
VFLKVSSLERTVSAVEWDSGVQSKTHGSIPLCVLVLFYENWAMLSGPLVNIALRVLRLRMKEKAPDMQYSYEYIE